MLQIIGTLCAISIGISVPIQIYLLSRVINDLVAYQIAQQNAYVIWLIIVVQHKIIFIIGEKLKIFNKIESHIQELHRYIYNQIFLSTSILLKVGPN